jgi:dihydrofolate synthase/folylpolyglutamate synthase
MILPDLGEEAIRQGLIDMHWPGRMEEILPGVFLDGAHNPGAVARICQTLKEWEGNKSLLFAVSDDKDYSEMIRMLSRICWKCIYVTRFKGDRGASVLRVQECFSKFCNSRIIILHDVEEAFIEAVRNKEENESLICIGSLYLVGEIRRLAID